MKCNCLNKSSTTISIEQMGIQLLGMFQMLMAHVILHFTFFMSLFAKMLTCRTHDTGEYKRKSKFHVMGEGGFGLIERTCENSSVQRNVIP